MKKLLLILALTPVLFLGGCKTLSEWKSRIFASLNLDNLYQLFEYIPSPNINSGASKINNTENINENNYSLCPTVKIMKNLDSMTQYMNPYEPKEKEKISDISITQYSYICNFEKPYVKVDINIEFLGNVGIKGRIKKTDKPNFAYPYFIAVTNNHGDIISKDIFAVTMSYKSGENSKKHQERIRQTIPLEKKHHAKNYKIVIGFQLSEEELQHNKQNKTNISYHEDKNHVFIKASN